MQSITKFLFLLLVSSVILTACSTQSNQELPQLDNIKTSFLESYPAEFNYATCTFRNPSCYLAGELTHNGHTSIATLFGYANSTLFQMPVPKGFQNIKGLDCFSNSICYIAGAASGFGGVPYPAVADVSSLESNILNAWPSDFGSLNSLACTDPANCITTGISPFYSVTQDGWHNTYNAIMPKFGHLYSPITCDSDLCIGFGTTENFFASVPNATAILVSTNQGNSFSAFANSSLIADVNSVSCVKIWCVFLASNYQGNSLIGTINITNKELTLQQTPNWVGFLNQISCISQTTCVAGGATTANEPLLFVTKDQGRTWSTFHVNLLQPYVDITAVSCDLTNLCLGAAIDDKDLNSEIFSFSIQAFKYATTMKLNPVKNFRTGINLNSATIAVVGDSIANSMESGMMSNASFYNANIVGDFATGFGCGLIIKHNSSCPDILKPFDFASEQHLQLAFIEIGIWDLGNFYVDGKLQHFGDPQFDQEWLHNFKKAVKLLTDSGAKVVALSLLYTQNYGLNGQPNPFQQPQFINIVNQLIQQGVAGNPKASYFDLNSYLYPTGTFNYVVDGKILRPDNHHFSLSGSLFISQLLFKTAQHALAS